MTCPSCKSEGFTASVIAGRCAFCDGTEGGNPPLSYAAQSALIRELAGALERRSGALGYYVNNPSAWDGGFNQKMSDLIAQHVTAMDEALAKVPEEYRG